MAHSYGAGCWQETSISAMWAILRLLDYPYNMTSGFPQTQKPKRKGKTEAKMFLITQTQKSYTITFTISYWLHKSTLFNMGGDTRTRIPGGRSQWGHLGSWVPQSLFSNWGYWSQRGKVTFPKVVQQVVGPNIWTWFSLTISPMFLLLPLKIIWYLKPKIFIYTGKCLI